MTVIGRYENEEIIDEGGMSVVYRVRDRELGRHVAIKRLRSELALLDAEVERFRSEARRTSQLDHPNIPAVHELCESEDGRPQFTMKLVEGSTLLELLKKSPIDVTVSAELFPLLQIFLKVCDAISFAHERGLVHCDLKPQNIMIGTHGQVFVMDWGISRNSDEQSRQVEGTAAYMSPEQALGGEVDERSDVFGLGGVLYRILTGRAPYVGDVASQLEQAKAGIVEKPWVAARNPALPRALCDIAMKALSRESSERYPSVQALADGVSAWLRGDVSQVTKSFRPGALIVSEGEEGQAAFVLVEGRCQVFKTLSTGRHVIGELGPGDVFGETAIFASLPRGASVEALTEVKATEITRPLLEEELRRTFWAGKLVKALAERFGQVNDRLASSAAKAESDQLEKALLRYFVLNAGGARALPWTPLKLHLCRTLSRTGPDVTWAVEALEGYELDRNEDLLRLVDS